MKSTNKKLEMISLGCDEMWRIKDFVETTFSSNYFPMCFGNIGEIYFLLLIRQDGKVFLLDEKVLFYSGDNFSHLTKQEVVVSKNFFVKQKGEGIGCLGGFFYVEKGGSFCYKANWLLWYNGFHFSIKDRKSIISNHDPLTESSVLFPYPC